jgi:DNA polymerase
MSLDDVLSRNFTKITPEYRAFARKKDGCRQCSIYDHYKHVGQSEGNAQNPTFMFIGEALGADEVEQKRPFVGRAGQRLRAELRKHAKTFNRETTLISNVLVCRPLNNSFPHRSSETYHIRPQNEGSLKVGKKQHPVEPRPVQGREVVAFCWSHWTEQEIALVRPKVIVTLGAKALDFVRGDSGITSNRGAWKFLPDYRAWSFATYHPSYVLRCQNDEAKEYVVEQFEEDIRKVAMTWADMVNNDSRMSMSDDDWDREVALDHAVKKRLIKQEPLADPMIEYADIFDD